MADMIANVYLSAADTNRYWTVLHRTNSGVVVISSGYRKNSKPGGLAMTFIDIFEGDQWFAEWNPKKEVATEYSDSGAHWKIDMTDAVPVVLMFNKYSLKDVEYRS